MLGQAEKYMKVMTGFSSAAKRIQVIDIFSVIERLITNIYHSILVHPPSKKMRWNMFLGVFVQAKIYASIIFVKISCFIIGMSSLHSLGNSRLMSTSCILNLAY